MPDVHPGLLVMFGSGETSRAGGQVFDLVARSLSRPLKVAVLETPAGFEVNSPVVAGRVADFIGVRLQNEHPEISVVPARKKSTPFSPDNPEVLRPLLESNLNFIGPGSPTYAARQLRDSLAWHLLVGRHRLGAALVMASAASVAVSAFALPVYEIYKVGEDLHWKEGLDLFAPYGLSLVIVPHWNNGEGGPTLDTSRCWMGVDRFAQLLRMLPPGMTILGIEEHTALVMDFEAELCRVMGVGSVTLIKPNGEQQRYTKSKRLAFGELGPFRRPEPAFGIPPEVWQTMQQQSPAESTPTAAPEEVLSLVEERQAARTRHDWSASDTLRQRIEHLGWQVQDTREGPVLSPL